MKIGPKMTKLQFAMLLVTFFGPPCILKTIIAFIVVLITCVYVLGLTVLNSGRALDHNSHDKCNYYRR